MVELAPSHADLVFDCVRVTWVAMIVSILFFDVRRRGGGVESSKGSGGEPLALRSARPIWRLLCAWTSLLSWCTRYVLPVVCHTTLSPPGILQMNLASALWTGLVAGLAYSFMVRLMYRQHFAAMQRLAEAHAAGAGSLARGPVHIPIVTVV